MQWELDSKLQNTLHLEIWIELIDHILYSCNFVTVQRLICVVRVMENALCTTFLLFYMRKLLSITAKYIESWYQNFTPKTKLMHYYLFTLYFIDISL